MKPKTTVIVGATSAIAMAMAESLAKKGETLVLVGRNQQRLDMVAAHLKTLGARTTVHTCSNLAEIEPLWARIWTETGGVDSLLVAQGFLPGPTEESGANEVEETFDVNTTGPIIWCQAAAKSMSQAKNTDRDHRTIAVLGSVAGDRGRFKNHIYSAAKAALETYCEGLSLRLDRSVKVCLIKPGITESAMTADVKRGRLMFSAEDVAASALAAMNRGERVSYAPPIWGWVMLIIKLLPRWILKKTKM
jgi:short-subunit dehydrogenase